MPSPQPLDCTLSGRKDAREQLPPMWCQDLQPWMCEQFMVRIPSSVAGSASVSACHWSEDRGMHKLIGGGTAVSNGALEISNEASIEL